MEVLRNPNLQITGNGIYISKKLFGTTILFPHKIFLYSNYINVI